MTEQATALEKPAELTARVAVYPSAIIKPVPSFIFSVPTGWVLDDAPDALVVARTPEQVDGFWVNAILSHDRVPRAVDFKQAAQATWARLQKTAADGEGDDGAARPLRHERRVPARRRAGRAASPAARSPSSRRSSSPPRTTRARPSTSSS